MRTQVHLESATAVILMAAVIQPNSLFQLGSIGMTQGVKALKDENIITNSLLLKLIYRHQKGDWTDCYPEDAEANRKALVNGSRIFSVYHLNPELTVWIITEAEDDKGNRHATTFMLPNDY